MKKTTIIKFGILFLIAIFVVHQVASAIYIPIKTESAVYYTADDGVNITGLIIRNEEVVSNAHNGVLHFIVDDGGRVSKDGVIADIYDNENASLTLSKIESLKSKIDDIEDILSYNDIDAVNLDLINSRFNEKTNQVILSAASGNYSNMAVASQELLSIMNRKQAALGTPIDLTAQLESLKSEYDKLSANLPKARSSIKALKSGYFVSKTDGYEKVFSNLDLNTVTPEFLENAKPEENGENVIGKIVSDYEWYIASEISIDESLKFKEGERLNIETSIKSCPTLEVIVKQINISETSQKAVVIFSCNQMNSDLAVMRSAPMTIIKAKYSGLKIPKKALRVVDSVRGVYVESGMQVNFVPVNIVYTDEDFIICEKQNENGNVLKLYDRVIVKGKNLYDGKIIS